MSTETANACNASVIGREQIHPELIVLRVRPDGKLFDFKPGQFAVLGLPGAAPRVPEAETETPTPDPDKLIRRAYSIASASVERNEATRSCGNFLMKPTVSATSTRGLASGCKDRTVVSRVAKS